MWLNANIMFSIYYVNNMNAFTALVLYAELMDLFSKNVYPVC